MKIKLVNYYSLYSFAEDTEPLIKEKARVLF